MKARKICLYKQKQTGIILIITLVLMVIIALGAVASIRLSGVDELVNNNTRSRILAMQAANAAIISCREGVFTTASKWKVQTSDSADSADDEGTLWKDIGNWTSGNISTIAAGFETYTEKPQCMIENITDFMAMRSSSPDLNQIVAYRITARGFSPNYQVNDDGVQVRGSQAWQQIIVGRTLAFE